MPSFDLMNKVELFVRTGTFHVDASKTSKKVTRAASKHFIYKDGSLWRAYRGRLLRVVRSDDEVREILIRYHDNNNHAGRVRTIREIMLMYYWVGVTEAVKTWIRACAACQSRTPAEPPEPRVLFCLAYGCDASSYVYPELDFHRFPKEAERRRQWLAVAQRDEGSLRSGSVLCSRHFEPLCYTQNEGQLTLSADAVPTIVPVTEQEDEAPDPSDEDFLHSDTLEDLLSTAAETTEPPEPPPELQEHRYCLSAPGPDPGGVQTISKHKKRNTVIEPSFTAYNQIARYLSHRVLPLQGKKGRSALKRMAKRFGLIDGQLMYTRVSPPVRVPRSREEVNAILQRFHDNQGHYGQGICQREITKHFYWASMTRDLARWISGCHTCLSRTKRKWLRCSVHNCTNCCGPVERGLGLTFHKFPLDNAALMDQWLKAVGRTNWHPRPRSSVCSTHFTEDCFDRSGDKVSVRPDAVPTLLVHSGSASPSRGPTQPAGGDETYFAKYDAVELYLRRRTYPPGLSYVEKNTFRRFCKKFTIKDDELHVVSGDQVRLVLRGRQQVEAALVDYHDELNHLDVNKCLRLLNERYFWKTMRADVLQWINSCSHCRNKRRKTTEQRTESLISGEDGDEDEDEDDVSVGDEEAKPAAHSGDRVVPLINPQPRIPILLHLRTPISLQPTTPIILQPRTPNAPFVARLWSLQRETNSSEVQVQVNPQPEQQTPPQDQKETSGSLNSTRTHHYVKAHGATTDARPPAELPEKPKLPQAARRQVQSRGLKTQTQTQTQTSAAAGGKRRSSSYGLEPVVAPTTKPWPVFTIAGSAEAQTTKLPPQVDSPADSRRTRKLQARTVIQQCSKAKVRTKPALDGADAQWAEIQEGMVVYVCFFHGASEDVTHQMASSLMTTKLFRKESGHLISVLDLPGSILLVPQDSLTGEPLPKRRVQYKGGCEPWWGAQLFSDLVSACRELVSSSVKCTRAGVKVEHGVYGQKQEIVLNSLEPLTLLLEF